MAKAPLKKTTIKLPERLWRVARIRALDEHTQFQVIVERALEAYLKTPAKRREREGGR